MDEIAAVIKSVRYMLDVSYAGKELITVPKTILADLLSAVENLSAVVEDLITEGEQ